MCLLYANKLSTVDGCIDNSDPLSRLIAVHYFQLWQQLPHLPPRWFYILLVWCSSFLICSLLSCLLSSSLHLPDHFSNHNYQHHSTISAAILLMLSCSSVVWYYDDKTKNMFVDLSLFALHLQVFNPRCCHSIDSPTTTSPHVTFLFYSSTPVVPSVEIHHNRRSAL